MPVVLRAIVIIALLFSTGLAQDSGWNICSEMPLPVYGGKAVAHDSLIYILGGFSDSVYSSTNIIQAYDPALDHWSTMDYTLQSPRHGFVADIYKDDLLIIGGASMSESSINSMERWNFSDPPVIADTNYYFNRTYATGLIFNDVFYLFGGYPDYRFTDDSLKFPYIYGYDIPLSTMSYSNSDLFRNNGMDGSLPYHQMSVLFNNKIYVFGGVLNGVLIDVYSFSSAEKNWLTVFPALFEERAGAEALKASDEAVIIIGGYNESANALSTTEYYYPEYHYSELGPDLHYARKELMAAKLGEIIYVFGGRDMNNNIVPYVERIAAAETTGLEQKSSDTPLTFELFKNYPNPFNPETTIKINNHLPQWVRLDIFNVSGSVIRTLFNNDLTTGEHLFHWDGMDENGNSVSSGLYFYRVITADTQLSKRMILMR